MTIQELFIRSNIELKKIIDQIADSQWSLEMLAGTTSKPESLADSVRGNTYDDAWVPDVLDGKTKDEVGAMYESIFDTPQAQLRDTYANYNERAVEKVCGFTELGKVVHLSYGDFPAADYLQHIVIYRSFRVHDIATLVGADTTMPADFVQALWDEFEPVAEMYRQMGVFSPALDVPEDADLQTKLLALAGRS